MQFITTTELRTKSTQLIQELQQGNEVYLVHRSKIVGVIVPKNHSEPKVVTAESLRKLHRSFGFKRNTTVAERKKLYDEQIEKKYGKIARGK